MSAEQHRDQSDPGGADIRRRSDADKINKEAQGIIEQYNQQNDVPKSPWHYYKLVNVQWSPSTVDLKTPVPIKLPLPQGNPIRTR